MKSFLFGLTLGIAGTVAVQWYGLDNAQVNVQDGMENAKEAVKQHRAETCRKRYLAATGCYQKNPQVVCDDLISWACNPADPNYHGNIPGG